MRFSRTTLRIVIVASFLMAAVGQILLWTTTFNTGLNAGGMQIFGALIFLFFSVDYLLTDKKFFKSKYYTILLLALGLFMSSIALTFADVLDLVAQVLYPVSIALMAMSFAAWAFDKPDVKAIQILKASFCLMAALAVILRTFDLPYRELAWYITFSLCFLADVFEFRNDWLAKRYV